MKKRNIGKTLAVAVIILFIGLAIQPAIATFQSDNNNVEYIRITSEFTGLRKKHTIKMTTQEVEEMNVFLDYIYMRLNNSKSDEETSQIINDAILELNKYDLLCGLSIEQIQKRFSKYKKSKMDNEQTYLYGKENSDCLIVGRVIRAYFIHPFIIALDKLIEDGYFENTRLPLFMFLYKELLGFRYIYGFPFFPIKINTSIAIGYFHDSMHNGGNKPAMGWIITIGSNGTKGWLGLFLGILDKFYTEINYFYIGVEGFYGIKISNTLTQMTSIIGYAQKVGINKY